MGVWTLPWAHSAVSLHSNVRVSEFFSWKVTPLFENSLASFCRAFCCLSPAKFLTFSCFCILNQCTRSNCTGHWTRKCFSGDASLLSSYPVWPDLGAPFALPRSARRSDSLAKWVSYKVWPDWRIFYSINLAPIWSLRPLLGLHPPPALLHPLLEGHGAAPLAARALENLCNGEKKRQRGAAVSNRVL